MEYTGHVQPEVSARDVHREDLSGTRREFIDPDKDTKSVYFR